MRAEFSDDVLRLTVDGWFGGGLFGRPRVEEDGDEHVAHDVHAGAGSGDDPVHG